MSSSSNGEIICACRTTSMTMPGSSPEVSTISGRWTWRGSDVAGTAAMMPRRGGQNLP